MGKHGISVQTKNFYTPIEAAIRWSGLLRQEAQLLKNYDPNVQLNFTDLSKRPRLCLNLEHIFDGLKNNELSYGKSGITSSDPALLQSPDLTIRHLDLKIWMRQYYPEERPVFLFGPIERKYTRFWMSTLCAFFSLNANC